jgi:hypothetical protein
MTQHVRFQDAEGIAALCICESLLLTLTDLKIISAKRTHAICLLMLPPRTTKLQVFRTPPRRMRRLSG